MAESAPSNNVWVFKLGGSLLNLPGLAQRLRPVFGSVSTKPLLVVGGGNAADLVREWDRVHQLDSPSAHWLAVRAMDFNTHLVETLLPEAVAIFSKQEAEAAWKQNQLPILKTFEWLQSDKENPDSLPCSWNVTSDSIAARVAIHWQAEGLMLLKSVEAPELIIDGNQEGKELLDSYFARLAPQLPRILWCNLRSEDAKIAACHGSHFESRDS